MQLKVGELARSTGLTVRTLHHYDEIGLLKPSGRSDSGYRLYGPDDIARLHGIQALRQMGLALADIAALFEGRGPAPHAIIDQQLRALDDQIARAAELRERLALMRGQLAEGGAPALDEWLGVLRQMGTYGKYFRPDEIKFILSAFEDFKSDWSELTRDVRAAIEASLPADSSEVQSLARRWMSLMLGWMSGNFDLMHRWGEMFQREPHEAVGRHAPPPEVIRFISPAIELRMEATRRNFTQDELARIRYVPECDWRALDARVLALVERDVAPASPQAEVVVQQWLALALRTAGGDARLRDRMLDAALTDPVLRLGSPMSGASREFLRAGLAAKKA
ncbi:MAG TPA: MerR family transcriptional regulator [Ramlibacter sp.]|uniref:MerR family transcriptional regulator n=1 Tax=Ramlibacter sp. TaxID=1917967 RepID=UPI002B62D16A|nr:MerR family transcriptional regulator [Ramlibacter sp.]HVZ45564.1 MerR family transcriptional regulator [Ramlibacter sp.]